MTDKKKNSIQNVNFKLGGDSHYDREYTLKDPYIHFPIGYFSLEYGNGEKCLRINKKILSLDHGIKILTLIRDKNINRLIEEIKKDEK